MSPDFQQIVTAAAYNTQKVEELIATIAYATEGLREAVKGFPALHHDDELLLWIKDVEIQLLRIRYQLQVESHSLFSPDGLSQ